MSTGSNCLWATIFVTSMIAVVAFQLIVVWERFAIPWREGGKIGE